MSDAPAIVMPGPLGVIANGIADRLKLVFPERQFTHDFVPARVTPAVWKSLLRRPPFIGVGWLDLEVKNSTTRQINGGSQWAVYTAIANERGPRARYFGDNLAPGLFQVVGVASAVLHGHTIEGAGSIEVHRADPVYIEGFEDDNLAIAMITMGVRTSLPLSDTIANVDVAALQTQVITWSFNNDGIVAAGLTDVVAEDQ